jgi:hypothetical protein
MSLRTQSPKSAARHLIQINADSSRYDEPPCRAARRQSRKVIYINAQAGFRRRLI